MNKLFAIFQPHPNLLAAISARADGSMRVQDDIDGHPEVIGNKEKFLARLNLAADQIIRPLLIHGTAIAKVGIADSGKIIGNTDGLITEESGNFLTVTVSDCLPIFLYHPEKNIVALLHAGWRGLDKKIITEAVREIAVMGGDAERMLAGIGPGIGACHYSVTEERALHFKKYMPEAVSVRENQSFLDLKAIAREELIRAGIPAVQIETHPDCTSCYPERYFSYHRDRPERVQPMMAVFGRTA